MFLMNTSPLVALQRKWEPFPPSMNCRYPVCFSESEEDLARTAVNAKVQMIINNLQSEEVTLDTSRKYGCIVQKKQKAAKDQGHKFSSNDHLLQEHINYTLRNYPTDSDGMDMEESAEFRPLALNSESDDSVDRDIEEAIQEHLRNKSQNLPPLPNNTTNLSSKDGDQPVQQKFPLPDAARHLFSAGCSPVGLARPYVVPGHGEGKVAQWASSPCSMSSDDSFEQSIKAEIEQFLKKKKQQARKRIMRRNKPFRQKEELQEKLALPQKSSMNRRNQSSSKQGGKASFSKRHPELHSLSPAKCLKSKTSEEPAACQTGRQADFSTLAVCDSFLLEEHRKNGKRQRLVNGGREERVGCTGLSDSSSDDGIEEAIQRYQLEKIQKAAESRGGCLSLQKKLSSTGKAEHILPSLTKALPEITPKAQSCKRKDISPKAAAAINRLGTSWNPLRKSRSYSPPENTFAKCSVTLQASCRTDTTAELMCAEAILDISKTILPLPTASENKLFSNSPSQSMLPSQYESDNNIVDSDDSIEQEIRAFLAVKAKTEHLIAKSTFQVPLSLRGSRQRAQSSKRTFPKCLKLPLNHKNKCKRNCEIIPQNEDARIIFSEMDYLDKNLPKSSVTQPKNERTGKTAIYPKDTSTPINSVSLPSPMFHSSHDSGSLVESIAQGLQKHGADDKSSSFDSDEDLDTAIKDLLRSKRKLKKKSKDQRVHCKNKVQFGSAEMHIFYKNERDHQSPNPTLLKKCIVSSRRDLAVGNVKKGPPRKPKTTIEFEPEHKKEYQTKPVSGAEIQEAPKTRPSLWAVTSLADESSSTDSDDSIEEEIQRFLAEKARASARIGGLPDATGVAGTLGAEKPQTALWKADWQLLKRGSPASETGGQKVGTSDLQAPELSSPQRYARESERNASHPSEPARSLREDAGSQASVVNPAAADTKGIELPKRRAAVQRKDIWEDRMDPRTLSSRKGQAERCKCQNYFQTTPSRGFKMSSRVLADLKGGGSRKKSELLGKRQNIRLSLLKQHRGGLAANLLREGSLPKVVVGSQSEAGLRDTEQEPEFQPGSLRLRSQERDGSAQEKTITTKVVSLVKHNPVGSQEGSASHNLPLPGSGIEETAISSGAAYVEDTVKVRAVLDYSPSWSKCEVAEGPCDLSAKGKVISHGRTAEEQAQKLLEGGSAELG